jgi:hypothetical protein
LTIFRLNSCFDFKTTDFLAREKIAVSTHFDQCKGTV